MPFPNFKRLQSSESSGEPCAAWPGRCEPNRHASDVRFLERCEFPGPTHLHRWGGPLSGDVATTPPNGEFRARWPRQQATPMPSFDTIAKLISDKLCRWDQPDPRGTITLRA